MKRLNALTASVAFACGLTLAYTQGTGQTEAVPPRDALERTESIAQAPPQQAAPGVASPGLQTGAQAPGRAGVQGVRPPPPAHPRDPREPGVTGVRPAPPQGLRIHDPAGAIPAHPILAQEGTIVLQGTVRTERERREIEMMLRRLPGVFNIYNLLRVSDDPLHRPVPAPGVTPPPAATPHPGAPPGVDDPRTVPPQPANRAISPEPPEHPTAPAELRGGPVSPPGRP